MKSPCKGCAERAIGCRANCEQWKVFSEYVEALRDARHSSDTIRAYVFDMDVKKRKRIKK